MSQFDYLRDRIADNIWQEKKYWLFLKLLPAKMAIGDRRSAKPESCKSTHPNRKFLTPNGNTVTKRVL